MLSAMAAILRQLACCIPSQSRSGQMSSLVSSDTAKPQAETHVPDLKRLSEV
jgi:hypothetical protein